MNYTLEQSIIWLYTFIMEYRLINVLHLSELSMWKSVVHQQHVVCDWNLLDTKGVSPSFPVQVSDKWEISVLLITAQSVNPYGDSDIVCGMYDTWVDMWL